MGFQLETVGTTANEEALAAQPVAAQGPGQFLRGVPGEDDRRVRAVARLLEERART